uniref:Si:dkey-172h23.2 n=1 Tax=Myripristis murdjan TaxID=586833 RepID=A0A667WNI5_9TELE
MYERHKRRYSLCAKGERAVDVVLIKGDVPVTGGDSTSEVSVSCSSTDDTASVCPSSSSPEGSQGLGCSWRLGGGGGAGAGGGGEAEDEAKDRVTEVPRRLLRPSVRSLSPLRRHSWGPGKNNGGDRAGKMVTQANEKCYFSVMAMSVCVPNPCCFHFAGKGSEKREKDKEGKEKDKRTVNGHLFAPVSSVQATQCSQCNKALNAKEAFHCTHCNACVHKSCRDGLPACAKVKMKVRISSKHSSSVPTVTMRNKCEPVFDDMPIKGLRYLSQSTDSLNRTNQVTESMESLTDEGTEMMDGQLMGEFEAEVKELEADSWSFSVDQQYLQQLDRELVKRQDVIYELMQTEMHHIRTLRIMSEVYSKGLQKEVQLEAQTLERLFPVLDELLEIHTQHLLRRSLEGGFIINRIGDILVSQFSGSNAESMKRVYGRFCSRHNEAVHFYKELLTKEKRFKAFIKKKMSSTIVRRLGIPECILLVTQRITKYPVLFQRLLQHTKVGEDDYDDLTDAVRLVKEVIAAVDGKVNEHEKKRRLKEFHSRMDSKSIMMMKSGQMFAREDLLRRRLFHDGALQLKNSQGRLKDVHALLLSDVLVFLQEKDQKYVFALLDQRSTVISLQKLIVREVANEERGLFLITAGIEKPEMMEVLASSKEERNTWMQLIQGAIEKDEDEGIPSETEDDKRQLETKAKEMRGEKSMLCVLETLQELVNGSLGGAMASVQEGGGAGPVCLPRRAETFGGFDSHQMSSSKNGDKDEGEDMASDLRRTESDSVLKKAVVVQQDSFIEDQRQALSERSSSCTSLSRPSSRPSSLIEQEKQRSLEKQRQELASLQRQQAAHIEEKRRREKDWEMREEQLTEKEMLLHVQEEEIWTRHKDIEEEKQELQSKKEEYQRDLERLRDAQRKLDREREAVQRQLDKMEELRLSEVRRDALKGWFKTEIFLFISVLIIHQESRAPKGQ